MVGSLERHSHGRPAGVARPALVGRDAIERPAVSQRAGTLVGRQQHTAQPRLRQHARVASRGAAFAAEASAPTDNIPRTAARAIRESRKWWRRSVIALSNTRPRGATHSGLYLERPDRQAETVPRVRPPILAVPRDATRRGGWGHSETPKSLRWARRASRSVNCSACRPSTSAGSTFKARSSMKIALARSQDAIPRAFR